MALKKTISLQRATHTIDATGISLGRLATRIAVLLRGKHKPSFFPHIDAGDHVVVSNVEKIRLTGQKLGQKIYRRYSGYPGGLKTKKVEQIFSKSPEEVLKRAVFQMLPGNRLRTAMIKRLSIKK